MRSFLPKVKVIDENQNFSFELAWVFICCLNPRFCLNLLEQISHLKFFSSLCMNSWFFKSLSVLHFLSQIVHSNVFSVVRWWLVLIIFSSSWILVWICSWVCNFLLFVKLFPHVLYLTKGSFSCLYSWTFKEYGPPKCFSQYLHLNNFSSVWYLSHCEFSIHQMYGMLSHKNHI